MDTQTPEAIARMWFEEVWNQKSVAAIRRLYSADCVAEGLPGNPKGPEAFEELFHTYCAAFPDIKVIVERTIAEGEWVAVDCLVTGTHTGKLLDLEPTGTPVTFRGIALARVSGGQIQQARNCFDFLTMYQKLGVVPAF
jgi:steroid delta-isomerase-like uncharacterized protein